MTGPAINDGWMWELLCGQDLSIKSYKEGGLRGDTPLGPDCSLRYACYDRSDRGEFDPVCRRR